MKLALALSLSLSTFGCMIGDPGSANDEDIIGGTADSGDPSVVMLRYSNFDGSTSQCTASVIAPKLLLTAAHCSKGYNYQYTTSASLDWTSPSNAGWISASGVFANPAYNGNTRDGHDTAVVMLSSAAPVAALSLGAAPAVGATVRAVGYGLTQYGTSGVSGTKYTKSLPVNAVTDREFAVGPDFTCHGDSGGPVFDTSGAIVGTTSYGDTGDCHGNDHFSRVDDNRAWIDSMISSFGGGASSGGGGGGGGGAGGGSTSTCSTQITSNALTKKVSCSNGTCQCFLNGTQLNTCTDSGSGCSVPGNCCGF